MEAYAVGPIRTDTQIGSGRIRTYTAHTYSRPRYAVAFNSTGLLVMNSGGRANHGTCPAAVTGCYPVQVKLGPDSAWRSNSKD